MSATTYYYSCCGDPADGSAGTGCDHDGGEIISAEQWWIESHGASDPSAPEWNDHGSMCCSDCDCAEEGAGR